MADKKCRQAIHRLVKQHPGAFVVVTGCYAQLKPGDVAKIKGVDVVLGAEQKGDLLQYLGDLHKHEEGEAFTTTTKDIRSFSPSCSRGDRTRFFLKVQDGCDYFCSYCTIPFARGRRYCCLYGGAGKAGCCRRRKRDRTDRREYRRFW